MKKKIDFTKFKESLQKVLSFKKTNFLKNKTGSTSKLTISFKKKWDALKTLFSKTPTFKELLIKTPHLSPWLYLIAGFLTADLAMQTMLSTVFLDPGTNKKRVQSVAQRVPVLKNRSHYNKITDKNIFCPGCEVPDIQAIAFNRPKDCGKADKMPGGPKLLGTIVLSDPQYSVATISAGASSKAIKKDDQVSGAGKVFEIRRQRVCFENQLGHLKYIELPQTQNIQFGQPVASALPSSNDEEIIQETTGEIAIKKEFLLEKLTDPAVLTSAASPPIYENGRIVGFKVLSIQPGSVFEQLVNVGDEIRGINGEPITSIPQIQKLFANIKNISDLNVTINRDGRTFEQEYKVQ